MHFEFLATYWWAVLAAMLAIFVIFVAVAGRGAGGGVQGQARQGWQRWRELSRRGADVQARIILTLFYFSLAAPFGIVRTLLADPLRLRRASRGNRWLDRRTRDLSLEDARRQF